MQPSASTIELADRIVITLVQHQPNLFPSARLHDEESARKLARSLAALRLELVQQLQSQPLPPAESKPAPR